MNKIIEVIKPNLACSEWSAMPEFTQNKIKPFKKTTVEFTDGSMIHIRFNSEDNYKLFCNKGINKNQKKFYIKTREDLAIVSEQKITPRTKSIWFPYKSHWGGIKYKYISSDKSLNRYPVYIISKGRYSNGLTTKTLDEMGVSHIIVVEKEEVEKYIAVANKNAKIVELPNAYLLNYDTCDDLDHSKSTGPGAARNFCIDHSKSMGAKRHWVMDDNLDAFHYLNNNEKYEVECPSTLKAAEDFVDRYANVPISGFNYYSFCKKTDSVPPFVLNTRVYSCLLIENNSGYRWRGRYNEDTDLSLRVLKDGLCTIQFNAFLCGKVTTQRMKGGNSKEFYNKEGTLPKSEMLVKLHPDVAKVAWRFNRWHHHVNYKKFKDNKLIKLKPVDNYNPPPINNYGLKLVPKKEQCFL